MEPKRYSRTPRERATATTADTAGNTAKITRALRNCAAKLYGAAAARAGQGADQAGVEAGVQTGRDQGGARDRLRQARAGARVVRPVKPFAGQLSP
eukprot:7188391-Pyramimonas_sp.AAC.2